MAKILSLSVSVGANCGESWSRGGHVCAESVERGVVICDNEAEANHSMLIIQLRGQLCGEGNFGMRKEPLEG